MREGGNQLLGPPQQRRHIADLDTITRNAERSQRVRARCDHVNRRHAILRERIVVRNEIDFPAIHAAIMLHLQEDPLLLVVNGRKAMPAFGPYLSDAQVAAVVNYVRSNFGNSYGDSVAPDDVKAARQ